MRIFTGLLIVALAGCTGDLVEIGSGNRDMSGTAVNPDLAGGNNDEMGPTQAAKFFPDIQSDLDAKGCTISGCHGGTQQPVIKAMATAQTDIDTNYMHVMGEISTTAPDQSLLLTKPLASSNVSHGGGKQFPSVTDPTYVKWLNWITAGAPKQ